MANLSEAQLITLGNDIRSPTAPQAVKDALAAGNNNALVTLYSALTADFWAYRTLVPLEEVSNAIQLNNVADITNADSDRLVKFYTLRPNGIFAVKATDRAAFDDIFSTAAGDESQQALIALWKRIVTVLEQLFVTGGIGTEIDPADLVVEGDATLQNIRNALAATTP